MVTKGKLAWILSTRERQNLSSNRRSHQVPCISRDLPLEHQMELWPIRCLLCWLLHLPSKKRSLLLFCFLSAELQALSGRVLLIHEWLPCSKKLLTIFIMFQFLFSAVDDKYFIALGDYVSQWSSGSLHWHWYLEYLEYLEYPCPGVVMSER